MKRVHIARSPALVAALSLLACSSVKVMHAGEGARYEPRPKGCDLKILEKAPKQTYEELGDLEDLVKVPPPGGAAEVLRDKACELGADALIVTRHIVTNAMGHVFVAGTAIKYVERPRQGPEERPEEEQPDSGQAAGSVKL
jgi:hypothetical protein